MMTKITITSVQVRTSLSLVCFVAFLAGAKSSSLLLELSDSELESSLRERRLKTLEAAAGEYEPRESLSSLASFAREIALAVKPFHFRRWCT